MVANFLNLYNSLGGFGGYNPLAGYGYSQGQGLSDITGGVGLPGAQSPFNFMGFNPFTFGYTGTPGNVSENFGGYTRPYRGVPNNANLNFNDFQKAVMPYKLTRPSLGTLPAQPRNPGQSTSTSTIAAGAEIAPVTNQPVDTSTTPAFGAGFGRQYDRTGSFSKKGKQSIKEAGYQGVKDFLRQNPGFNGSANAVSPQRMF